MKRAPELKVLSSDHHRALVIARKAKKTDLEKISQTFGLWREIEAYYKHELETHLHKEEKYLVPHLEAIQEVTLVNRLKNEHESLRRYFKPGASRTNESLSSFGDLLEKHVRFEERELFNIAQTLLSQETLTKIEEGCNENLPH